ncbi:uroporphyrinogen decarboxylase family protein [Pseudoflavonifractor phocaeensis]|uniref:uroporphyrinogen decarboxylase family protein n=1 Tax=Pseudoflavonifractor phocaeensis TaxID=1870988 RepID=UPI002109061D|nr:uroporphyrinogen decarboxylase [Pseudoflavonifractor phocaeensis]
MTPKEILFSTLRRESPERTPWVPLAGVHAGALTRCPADELLTDGGRLLNALLAVNRLYRPDGQAVTYDLSLEAECLGCDLRWHPSRPPSVFSHPLADNMIVPCECTLPRPEDGRLPLVLDVTARLKAAVGGFTALIGVVCGPFTLASHLRGGALFSDLYDDPRYVRDLLDYCAKSALRLGGLLGGAGADVILAADPLAVQLSPDCFSAFLTPPLRMVFDGFRAAGLFSALSVCGDAAGLLPAMCRTGPDAVFVGEDVDLPLAKSVADRYNVCIGGNLPLNSLLLRGTPQAVLDHTAALLDAVPDRTGLILATGCDIPYGVPPENGAALARAVRVGSRRQPASLKIHSSTHFPLL